MTTKPDKPRRRWSTTKADLLARIARLERSNEDMAEAVLASMRYRRWSILWWIEWPARAWKHRATKGEAEGAV